MGNPAAGAAIGGSLGGLADGSGSKKANQGAITGAQNAQIDASNRVIDLLEQRYGDATRNLGLGIDSGNAAQREINDLLGIDAGLSPTGGIRSIGETWTTPGAYRDIAARSPGGVDWAAYVRANPDALAQWSNQTPDLQPFGGDINRFGAFHYQNDGARRDISPFTLSPEQAQMGVADRQQGAIDRLKASPLYQSLFGNGRDAILGASSATGGLRGGNVNTSLADFGRDTLAQVIQQQLANLGGIASGGRQGALGLAGIGANNANAIGNEITNIGDAQAGGILNRRAVANANDSSIDTLFGQLFNSVGGASGVGGALSSILKGGIKFDPMSDSPANGGITGRLGVPGGDFLSELVPGVEF